MNMQKTLKNLFDISVQQPNSQQVIAIVPLPVSGHTRFCSVFGCALYRHECLNV